MALMNASGAAAEVPAAFSSAIEAYGLGRLSLAEVRQSLARALEQDPDAAEAIHELLDDELRARTLSIADYGELVGLVGAVVSENVPTEFAEETPAESGIYRVVEEGTLVRDKGEWPVVQARGSDSACTDEGTRPFGDDSDEPIAARRESKMPAAGTVLRERFRLDQEVARGAMGVVFKATDLLKLEANAGEPLVAVKLIAPELSQNTTALRAFHIEVASTQHLSHPNIIHVFELDRDGDQHFITMEWLEGESLADLLDRHGDEALPAEFTDAVIAQLCDALVYAHEHGVVHADVKPGNVFVLETGEIKLIDFGIAQADAAGQRVGAGEAFTPAYAGCERLEGDKPEPRDDLFSLACIIYRLLAGRRAYGPLTALEAEAQGAEPLPIAGLDAVRWAALSRALAVRRNSRQRTVREFVADYCATTEVRKVDEAFDTTSLPIIDTVSEAGRAAAPELKPGMQIDVVFDEPSADFQETDASVIFEAALEEQALEEQEREQQRAAAAHLGDREVAEKAPGVAPSTATTRRRSLISRPPLVAAAAVLLAIAAGVVMVMSSSDTATDDVAVATLPPATAVVPAVETPAAVDFGSATTEPVVADTGTAVTDEFLAEEVVMDDVAELAEQSEAIEVVAAPEPAVIAAAPAPAPQPAPVVEPTSIAPESAALAESAPATPEPVPVAETAPVAPEAVPVAESAPVAPEPVPVAEPAPELTATAESAPPSAPLDSAEPAPADAAAMSLAATTPAPVTDFAVAGFVAANAGDLAIEPEAVFDPREPVPLSDLTFVEFVEPRAPRGLNQLNLDGWVEVEFRVGTDGVTRNIEVTGSNVSPRFEAAVVTAVKKWRFEPYLNEGEPVAVYSAVRLRFEE